MNERQDIKAFIDGELSPERAAEVRAAIDSDPELMEEYKSMKDITQRLRSLTRSPQPKGAEAVMPQAALKRRFRWGEGIAIAAVAALLVFFVAPKLLMRRSSDASVASNAIEGAAMSPLDKAKDERISGSRVPATLKERSMGLPELSKRGQTNSGEYRQPQDALAGLADSVEKSSGGRDYALSGTAEVDQNPSLSAKDSAKVTPAEALRQVIKSASLIVAVDDVQKAVDDATLMVRGYGGYMESTSVDNGPNTMKPTASMTIRIPQDKFEEALTKLGKYGQVDGSQSNGEDVTAQVTDIEARIKTLKAEEDSLREILRNAHKVGDILEVRDRISDVRQQIESYDAQRLTLGRMAALSTISVRFDGPEKKESKVVGATKSDTWFKDTYAAASGMLKDVGKFVAQTLTFAFVLIPVWVPLALMALWFRKRAFHTEQAA